jgi:hypothetical protein
MKTRINLALTSVMVASAAGLACAQPQLSRDTNLYSIYSFAQSDDRGGEMGWYTSHASYHRDLQALGLASPLPEQLPAWRDTNGHWGAPVDGFQLSVRFHRWEFLAGEPVHAMVIVRNLASSPRAVVFSSYGKSDASKNFTFVLHHGTNSTSWSWMAPSVSEWYRGRGYFRGQRMEAHSQVTFFVRLDQIFDLSQLEEYSIQATWTARDNSGQAIANLVSGKATHVVSDAALFRVVDKLSPSEIAATNAFARGLKETERKGREEWLKAQKERLRGMSNGLPAR